MSFLGDDFRNYFRMQCSWFDSGYVLYQFTEAFGVRSLSTLAVACAWLVLLDVSAPRAVLLPSCRQAHNALHHGR